MKTKYFIAIFVAALFGCVPTGAERIKIYSDTCDIAKQMHQAVMKIDPSKPNIEALNLTKVVLLNELDMISTIWKSGIDQHRDWQTDIANYRSTCEGIGAQKSRADMMNWLAARIKKSKNENEKSAFLTLKQMESLASSPRGSLMTFNSETMKLHGEIDREIAAAQI